MKIGIIGAGDIGATLAKKLTDAGHTVKIANSRGPETLTEVVKNTGATAVPTSGAVQDVDIIVVTITLKNIPTLKPLFEDVPDNVIVIDTNNYYPLRDDKISELENDVMLESEWVSKQLGRPVVKVFNNIFSFSLRHLGKPKGSKGRIALPVAGDNESSKQVVIDIVNAIGFDGYDAGLIKDSWRFQPGTPVYSTDLELEQSKQALTKADRTKSHANRDEQVTKIFSLYQDSDLNDPKASDALVKLVRSYYE
jgi:hypothetical protein